MMIAKARTPVERELYQQLQSHIVLRKTLENIGSEMSQVMSWNLEQ